MGDWYVNRLVVDRRPLVLLISAVTLLPMLLPARDVGTLATRLPDLVGQRLRHAGIAPQIVAAGRAGTETVFPDRETPRALAARWERH